MMQCPHCETDCYRDEADVGVGVIYGPWGCPGCGWSEDERYNRLLKPPGPDAKGGYTDQYGGYWPVGSTMAQAFRLADETCPRGADSLVPTGSPSDEAR